VNFKLLLPSKVLIDRQVSKIVAEGEDGAFCLLPRHQDFVSALVPGLLSYLADDREEFVAVDEGILVKTGFEVRVSTRRAVLGPDLGTLKETVAKEFLEFDERQRHTQSAMAKLEANFARKYYELSKQQYE
jgi:F-type H+-transporting ATPase subunit epsilon